MTHRGRNRRGGNLVLGLFLLLLGVLFLAEHLGFDLPGRTWKYWPFLLIGLGVARSLSSGRSRSWRAGYWLIVTGIYGWISEFGLFGLGWDTAWPVFLLAAGFSMVVGSPARDRHDGDRLAGAATANAPEARRES